MAVRLHGIDRIGIFEGTTIGECCGDRVHEATFQDITLRDLIGRFCFDRLSRLDIFEDALLKRHSFDFSQGDRLDLVVDIRDEDGKGYDLIEVIFLIFMRLGYHVVRVNALIDNSQRTKPSGYHVVGQLCPFERSVGEDVLARSDKCLAAGYVIRETFAFRESVSAYRHFVVRQRLAVVFLRSTLARQRYVALRDRQLAVLGLHREPIRYVVAIGVLHDRSAGHDRGVFARVRFRRARRQAFHRVGVAFHFERQRFEAAYGLLFAVVLRLVALRNYRDLVLLRVFRGVGYVASDRGGDLRIPAGEVVALFGSYSGGSGGGGAIGDVGVDDLAVVVIVACQRAMVAFIIGDREGPGVVEVYLYRFRRLRHQILFAIFDVVESVAGDGSLVVLRLDGIADLFGDGLRFLTGYDSAVLINVVDDIGDRAIGSIVEDNLPQASRDRSSLDLLNRVVVLILGHRRGDRHFYDALDFSRGNLRLRSCYGDLRTLHVVVDGVFLVLPRRVVECNDVLAGVDVEVDALGHRIDAIARDRDGAGRDL